MLITSCNSIHTIGMRYPIDVVFLDADWYIVKMVEHCPGVRFCRSRKATQTLEFPAGDAARLGLAVGQRLLWKELVH